MITELALLGLGWAIHKFAGKDAPTAPTAAPWPGTPKAKSKISAQEDALLRAMQSQAPENVAPLTSSLPGRFAEAAAQAYGPSPLLNIDRYHDVTRPGGQVLAPEIPYVSGERGRRRRRVELGKPVSDIRAYERQGHVVLGIDDDEIEGHEC